MWKAYCLACLEGRLLEWVLHVRQVGWKTRLVICVKSEVMGKSGLSRVSAQALDFSRWQEAAELAMQGSASAARLHDICTY